MKKTIAVAIMAGIATVAGGVSIATASPATHKTTCSTGAIHGTILASESLRTFTNYVGDGASNIMIQTFICNPGVSGTMKTYYDNGDWDAPMGGTIGVWYTPAGGGPSKEG